MVKAMTFNGCLGLFHSTAIVWSAGVLASSPSFSSSPSSTTTTTSICFPQYFADGDCDISNNSAECGWDGGDCCKCTCVPSTRYSDDYLTGGDFKCDTFDCKDPDAPCFGSDDGITSKGATSEFGCFIEFMGDGDCDFTNNTEECDFDGGDCCECTCVPNPNAIGDTFECDLFDCQDPTAVCYGDDILPPEDDWEPMSYEFTSVSSSSPSSSSWEDDLDATSYDLGPGVDEDDNGPMSYDLGPWNDAEESEEPTVSSPWQQLEPLPGVDGAVEVGTKTEVSVAATAHDKRPGSSSSDVGCADAGGDGCIPTYTRDGISTEVESRWSCAPKLVPEEGPCQIEYKFAEPQDVMDIHVAFWKGNQRTRTLDVYFDGELARSHESYAGSNFNELRVDGRGVRTVMLESANLLPDEWLSLIEVLIFVAP